MERAFNDFVPLPQMASERESSGSSGESKDKKEGEGQQ